MSSFPLDSVDKSELVSLTYELPASPDEVLAAFTVADLFRKWYTPRGWKILEQNFLFEPRVGGRIQLVMQYEAGTRVYAPLYLRFESLSENLLEFSEAIAGPDGGPTDQLIGRRIRLTPGTVVTDEGVGEGTVLTLEEGPLPPAVHDNVRKAWKESLTQLGKVLAPEG